MVKQGESNLPATSDFRFWTVNAVGTDGNTYPISFECADIVDAENLIRQIGVTPDEAGICELMLDIL